MPNEPIDQNQSRSASVIIPAYNAERFLERTLRSVLAQDYEDFEVIVVDDGSTDSTNDIASKYSKIDHRVRLISTSNSGVAAARNTGIFAAKSEFIAFLDADDLWHPAKLRLQISSLCDKPECAAAYTWHLEIDENDDVLRPYDNWQFDGYILCRHLCTWPVGNGSTLVVRRQAALAIGGFDTDFVKRDCGGAEDLDFELRLAEKYKFTCVPNFLVGYRKYDGAMSSNGERMARSAVLAVSRALERNPALPSKCAKEARTKVLRYAAGACGLSVVSLRYMLPLFKLDIYYGFRAVAAKGRFILNFLLQSGVRPDQKQGAVKFYGWANHQSQNTSRLPCRHLDQLRKYDQMLELEWSKPWDEGAC
ncbi:glycosyltransferase family 2 protein [Microvirga sp. TS319]|uniref:glycosyltransferase family 2 protein n=1 Tax=Microvirga sp. TS319 TaxID=3241165 RepID=UPI00351A7698